MSDGLLGDAAGFLAVAIRAATTRDGQFADACYRVLQMFSIVFGVPLSVASLLTGAGLSVFKPGRRLVRRSPLRRIS